MLGSGEEMNVFSMGQVLPIFPSDASANIISSHKHTSASTWFHLLSSHVSPSVSMLYATLTVYTWLKKYKCLFLMLYPTHILPLLFHLCHLLFAATPWNSPASPRQRFIAMHHSPSS